MCVCCHVLMFVYSGSLSYPTYLPTYLPPPYLPPTYLYPPAETYPTSPSLHTYLPTDLPIYPPTKPLSPKPCTHRHMFGV